MALFFLSAIFINLLFVSFTTPYSSGPGTCNADESEVGGGMGGTATKTLNFDLSFNGSNYYPGNKYSVTLNGTDMFKGLLLYAENAQKEKVGSWNAPSGYYTMESCGGALGHSNANDKSVGSFTWTAPAVGSGAVTFKAAVVVYKSKWTIISTNSIAIDPSYVPPPTTVSSSTTTSTPTSKPPSSWASFSLHKPAEGMIIGLYIYGIIFGAFVSP